MAEEKNLDEKVLDTVRSEGPISPHQLEVKAGTAQQQAATRLAVQRLLNRGQVAVNDDLKLEAK